MKYYKDALYIAARQAYREEVVLPEMVELTIGKGLDFETAQDWIEARMQEWLDDAELERKPKYKQTKKGQTK
jgi:hypothetical protein